MAPLKRIAVTGGAGQIAYHLLFRLAQGEVFGLNQPIALHVLELPSALQALEGVCMELEDCAYPLLREIHVGHEAKKVFQGVDVAVLVGSRPRGPGMERQDLLLANGRIFQEQGRALNEAAHPDAHVLVVGNPCNTNCLIAMNHAPNLPKSHFHALTRLDENRAKAQLAIKANVAVSEVTQMAIWGNHSATQVPDFVHAKIQGRSALEVIEDRRWLENHFFELVQNRGAEVIAKRGLSSAASAACAIIDSLKSLYTPTPKGEWFSAAICSDNNPYGIEKGLIFSFPCRSNGNGEIQIVSGLHFDPFLREKICLTERELIEERQMIQNLQ